MLTKCARAIIVAALAVTFTFVLFIPSANAHRSGCHRWHTCPSDSGCYVVGQTSYDTCGNTLKPLVAPTQSTFYEIANPNNTGRNVTVGVIVFVVVASVAGKVNRKRSVRRPATPPPATGPVTLTGPAAPAKAPSMRPPTRGHGACVCGGRMVRRTRRSDGKPFLGCSRYPSCRHTTPYR